MYRYSVPDTESYSVHRVLLGGRLLCLISHSLPQFFFSLLLHLYIQSSRSRSLVLSRGRELRVPSCCGLGHRRRCRSGWLSNLRCCLPRKWSGFDPRSRPDLPLVWKRWLFSVTLRRGHLLKHCN
jgi:hypothetical protein